MKKLLAIATLVFSVGAVADENIQVSNVRSFKIDGGSRVEGIAHNGSNATLRIVTVNFKLYDREGNVIGNAAAAAQDIAPGENFKFAAFTTLDFAQAKLSSVDTM